MEETSYSSRQKQADGTQHSDQLPLMQILLVLNHAVTHERSEGCSQLLRSFVHVPVSSGESPLVGRNSRDLSSPDWEFMVGANSFFQWTFSRFLFTRIKISVYDTAFKLKLLGRQSSSANLYIFLSTSAKR
ncbi:hypothetical protein GBA52_015442 [Prunus armeniaca]|nr:hypothetical protein GBA52_015442 [Prunus armeniaca]